MYIEKGKSMKKNTIDGKIFGSSTATSPVVGAEHVRANPSEQDRPNLETHATIAQATSNYSDSIWFYRALGICSEYFIIGDPRKKYNSYVFRRDSQTGEVSHYRQFGVFDDYQRVSNMPNWVRPALLGILLSNRES